MTTPDPVWKRIVGGLCGLGILVGILMLAKSDGVSGEKIQEWQEAIVIGAVAAAGLVFLIKRRKR